MPIFWSNVAIGRSARSERCVQAVLDGSAVLTAAIAWAAKRDKSAAMPKSRLPSRRRLSGS